MSVALYTRSDPTSLLVEARTIPRGVVSFKVRKRYEGVMTGLYLSTSITLMVTEALLERFGDRLS